MSKMMKPISIMALCTALSPIALSSVAQADWNIPGMNWGNDAPWNNGSSWNMPNMNMGNSMPFSSGTGSGWKMPSMNAPWGGNQRSPNIPMNWNAPAYNAAPMNFGNLPTMPMTGTSTLVSPAGMTPPAMPTPPMMAPIAVPKSTVQMPVPGMQAPQQNAPVYPPLEAEAGTAAPAATAPATQQ